MEINIQKVMLSAGNNHLRTRIYMTMLEQKQFFDKHIKGLFVDVDGEGNLTIQLKNR